jgi:precorrin-3B methylase
MEELKLHAFGQSDHIQGLIEKYNRLISKLKENKNLSELEKKTEFERLNESFNKEQKDTKTNLY